MATVQTTAKDASSKVQRGREYRGSVVRGGGGGTIVGIQGVMGEGQMQASSPRPQKREKLDGIL